MLKRKQNLNFFLNLKYYFFNFSNRTHLIFLFHKISRIEDIINIFFTYFPKLYSNFHQTSTKSHNCSQLQFLSNFIGVI